jgi:type II secretory pathway component PulF
LVGINGFLKALNNFSEIKSEELKKMLFEILDEKKIQTLEAELRNKKYFIIDITSPSALSRDLAPNSSFSFFSRITTRDLSVFTRQFSILINAGMSLTEALGV